MNFLVLATDYDGTLASDGRVLDSTISALEKVRQSGRKLVLVTGRELAPLLRAFPRYDLFEWIVAENGAVLYCPHTGEQRLLTEPVPQALSDELRRRGIDEFSVGDGILAAWHPHECTVLETLRDLKIDRQIIFNKGAVMVLPTGVNKASGLTAALDKMKISHHNTVAVGDAENDIPMLVQCECSVAVSNALDTVKQRADFIENKDHGAGVEQLIDELLRDDLRTRMATLHSNGILLGTAKNDPKKSVFLPSLGHSILVAGPSGSGKSTAITGFLERLAEASYQFCLFDPEGDYEGFSPAINLGNPHYVPLAREVVALLERMHSAVVNLLGVSLDNRPIYVAEVLRSLEGLRVNKGHPHWFILDEAHHIFPSEWPQESITLADPPKGSLLLTVHPKHVRKEALSSIDIVIAVGKEPHETIREFCRATAIREPTLAPVVLERWEVFVWFRTHSAEPFVVTIVPGQTEHKRHTRKYADGDLRDRSFIFHGADGKLNLCAQNFNTFIRMARGVDDETWIHHLRAHDYSNWIRDVVKDDSLAAQVEEIESRNCSAEETRKEIFEAIEAKYTSSE
jgi:hypothetical protein